MPRTSSNIPHLDFNAIQFLVEQSALRLLFFPTNDILFYVISTPFALAVDKGLPLNECLMRIDIPFFT